MGWRFCGRGFATVSTAAISGPWTTKSPPTRRTGLWPRFRPPRRLVRDVCRTSRRAASHAYVTQVIEQRFWDKRGRRDHRRIQSRLVADRDLSRPELQHASHRSADGGLRGDGRARLSRKGGEHRLIDHRSPRPQRGVAGGRAFHRKHGRSTAPTGAIHVPPSGTTPGHALESSRLLVEFWELGGRSKGLDDRSGDGAFRKRCRSAGTGTLAAFTTRSTGATSRIRRIAIGGPAPRASAPQPRSAPSTPTRSMRNGTGASGASSQPM